MELSQTVPSRKHLTIQRHLSARITLITDIQETVHIGQMLLGRIPLPVIPEYRLVKLVNRVDLLGFLETWHPYTVQK